MRISLTRYALLAMLALGMALLGPALPGGVVGAVTVSVPCNTTALIAAVANPANDVLDLAAGCTYTLTAVDNDTEGPNGLPDIARTLTINGNGAIIERSSAGGTPAFRVFHVAGAGNLTLGDVTIRNGHSPDGADGSFSGEWGQGGVAGGGIYNRGTLALNAAIVSGNTSGKGGNGAGNEGEGEDAGWGGRGGDGGGIVNLGTLTLTASTLSGNATGPGGAAGTGTGGAENGLSGDSGYGGGIYNEGTLTVARSTISGNITGTLNSEGGCGGAIGSEGGTVTIVNSTLSGNTAHNCGGAMNAARTATSIINSTITGNALTNVIYSGGGISAFFGTVHLSNTIIAGNTSTRAGTEDCFQYASGATISDGHNLVGSGTGCPSGGTGDLTVAPANVFTTVLSATLANNGGPTQTHALLAGSPALNVADSTVCADTGANKVNGIDQRGVTRPLGACDIGAYERDVTGPTVTINQASGQADPTSTSPINFTVVFNEPVTGFGDAAGDVTLSGTAGATTAVVTEIAPNNGTTYNVAVSGMIANGTVIASLPAGAAQDFATNASAASTSTDNTVTFTSTIPTQLDRVGGTLSYGDTTATLTARLRTLSGGTPIAGQTIVFTLAGQPACGGGTGLTCPVTNALGVATLSGVPVGALNAGTYANRVCASFAGSGEYQPTGPTCGPLTVARKILWLKPTDRYVGLRAANPPTDPHLDAACAAPNWCLELSPTRGSSFAPGESFANLNLTNLRFQYSRNPPSTNATEYVGKTYRMTAFGATSGNYDIRYDPGTMTVR